MSLTNKVLYDIDQREDTTPTQKETARKNIGAYEDKTAAGGGTGIPKADLASDVQSSLGKADSSVQSVTSNGQALTKSAAGAIDIPKATDTKWGVVQVVNELKDNQNVIPNSRVIKEAVDGLSAALQARATFWTVQEWQTQSAQPGDPSKIYYVGPKGVGNDQYDMYEWRTSTLSYVLTDESTISLDGYWHGAPDIVGEDTVAPFITSIEKKADDTVKYRTCSATVGDLGLPVFMDSGVVTPADLHYMYPTVNESTPYEEVKALVDAGYRPIFVPSITSIGTHTRYILTGAKAKGYTPAFIFTALIPDRRHTLHFTSEIMQTVICQDADPGEDTWVWNTEIPIPNIPEPNDMERDVGKVLTVGEYGALYWDEPDGGNNVEVRAGTNNLHVTSADVNDKTVFTMSADYYHSSGNYAGTYTGPGTVIVDPTIMNLESTNSAYGYRSVYEETSKSSVSDGQNTWDYDRDGNSRLVNIGEGSEYIYIEILGEVRPDMEVLMWAEAWTDVGIERIWEETLTAEDLEAEKHIVLPKGITSIAVGFKSDNIAGEGYSVAGYNLYSVGYTGRAYEKGELAWKDETYRYVDNEVGSLLPSHTSLEKNRILTVSGDSGELGWLPIDRTLKIKKTAYTTDNELYVAVNNAYNAGYIPVIEVNLGQGSFDYYYLVRKTSSNFDFENSTTYTGTPPKGVITRWTLSEDGLSTSTVSLQRALSTEVTGFTSDYSKQSTPYYTTPSGTVHSDLSIELTIPAGAVALIIARSLVSFNKDTSLKPYEAHLHIGSIGESYLSAGYANLDAYGDGTGTTASMECSRIYDNRASDTALTVPLDTSVGGDDTSAGDKARRNMTGVIYYYSILTIAGL